MIAKKAVLFCVTDCLSNVACNVLFLHWGKLVVWLLYSTKLQLKWLYIYFICCSISDLLIIWLIKDESQMRERVRFYLTLVHSCVTLCFVFPGEEKGTAVKGETFGQKGVEGKDESVIK